MKRITILLTLVVFTVSATFAQKGKVTSAKNLKDTGKLEEALKNINEAIDPNNEKAEKSIPWPQTWEVRGEIYQAIGESKDENIKKLSDDPFTVALESYKKALELDTKNRNDNSIKIKLTFLINDLNNKAAEEFKAGNYKNAVTAFEQILDIENLNVIKADDASAIDTATIYNTALASSYAKDYDRAIKYYDECIKYGYNGADAYPLLASVYIAKNDTLGALDVLKKGFEKYPDDQSVLDNMIEIYMNLKKTDDAMKYLQMAIDKEPKEVKYRFAKGRLYEDLGEEENAVKTYEKCIEIDPNFFSAYFNLGVLYYNKGVELLNRAKELPPNENAKYEAEAKKADEWFVKSLPFMEKCRTLEPDDQGTLESLKSLYYRMQKMDKYNEILQKLGQ